MSRRALLVGVGGALLVILIWYFLLWSPRNRALEAARERREAAEQQESQLRTEIRRLQAAQREEPIKRAQLEALRSAIPDEANLGQFILDANDAAARSGIEFMSISPTPPAAAAGAGGAPAGGGAPPAGGGATTTTTARPGAAPGGGPGAQRPAEIRLTVQIKGGYFQVLDFLNRLDALPRLVVTDSLNVTSDPSARLTVSVTARMFTRTVPAGFGPAAGAPGAPGAPGGGTPTTAPGGGGTPTTAPGGRP